MNWRAAVIDVAWGGYDSTAQVNSNNEIHVISTTGDLLKYNSNQKIINV